MKSEVFKTAWAFIKDGLFTSFAAALKAAWAKIQLIAKLKKGVAYFQFKKADGSVRNAIGTLNNVNFSYESKGSNKKTNINLVTFWDIEKRAFRSLNMTTFIGFN